VGTGYTFCCGTRCRPKRRRRREDCPIEHEAGLPIECTVRRLSRGTPPKAAEAETAEERFFPLKSLLTLLAGILRGELESSANGVELQFDATE
jgi:hypothetical protein